MYKGRIVFPTDQKVIVFNVVKTLENIKPAPNTPDYSEADVEVTDAQLANMDRYWGAWIWSLKKTK